MSKTIPFNCCQICSDFSKLYVLPLIINWDLKGLSEVIISERINFLIVTGVFFIISQSAAAEQLMVWSTGDFDDACWKAMLPPHPGWLRWDGSATQTRWEFELNQRSQNLKAGWSCPSCNASCHINPLHCSNKTHPSVSDTASLATLKALKMSSWLDEYCCPTWTQRFFRLRQFVWQKRFKHLYCFLFVTGLKWVWQCDCHIPGKVLISQTSECSTLINFKFAHTCSH